jgi:PKD repeat protein
MRTLLRSLSFCCLALLGGVANAQFPYTLIVQGTVAGCTPFQQVTITTTGSTSPSVSYTLEIFPPNCTYDTIIQLNSTYAGVLVSTLCNGQVVTASDSTTFNFINDSAVIVIDLNCTGGLPDCLGIPNGPNVPGTPCNDGDPNTINDLWSPNCACIGVALPPSSVFVTGTVSTCNGGTYPVHIFTTGTTPPIDTLITTGPNCTYEFLFNPQNTSGWVNVEVSCDSGLTWMWDSLGFTSTPGDTLLINFTCGGLITDCTGVPGGANLPGTPCSDNNPNTINDTWSPACTCLGTPVPPTCQAAFTIAQIGPWAMQATNQSTGMGPIAYSWWMPDGSTSVATNPIYTFTAPGTYGICLTIATADTCTSVTCDTVFVDSSGTITTTPLYYDCLGIPNGNAVQGTPCQIPGTILQGVWGMNCVCDTSNVLLFDCLGFLNGPNMPGTACNDGDTLTVQDTWTIGCACIGVPVNYFDCMGVLNGPDVIGTPCDDGNPATINDTWSANCVCTGAATVPCQAGFWVLQAYTIDSLNNVPVPTPYELWIWNLSSGGSGTYSFLWNFGDGSSSTAAFPTHTYSGNGPYLLCLTIDDGAGCISTSCDSVSIDNNGLYTGIMGGGNDRQNGFTINVQDPLTSGVNEALDLDGIAAWPNPVVDELNIALTSAVRGTADVTVLDMSGRMVLAERRTLSDGRNQLLLQTTTLSPGLYTVRISNGNASISQRFVKAN